MKNLQYDQLISTKHAIEVSGFPFLTGNDTLFGQAQTIRTEIWWRANAYLAQNRQRGHTEDLQQAMSQLPFKTDASWWIASQTKPIAAILSDLTHENHDRESGFLNC